jgi:large conductance mechanosensitive channel
LVEPRRGAHAQRRSSASLIFGGLTFTINGSVFHYGAFLCVVITFLTVVTAAFFLVANPMNALMARVGRRRDPQP